MPIPFTITRDDLLRGKTIEPGWYKAIISKVLQEPAKTDGSTNTVFEFKITQDGPFKDVPVRKSFSEKATGFVRPLLEACGAAVSDNGGNFDLEKGIGTELLIYIKNNMYNNRLTNSVEDYRAI